MAKIVKNSKIRRDSSFRIPKCLFHINFQKFLINWWRLVTFWSFFSKFPIEILIFSLILADFAIFSIGRQISPVDFQKLCEPILESAWPRLSPHDKEERIWRHHFWPPPYPLKVSKRYKLILQSIMKEQVSM